MVHYPVNHQFRHAYRLLAGLIALYYLAFGILGLIRTWGDPIFGRDGEWVLWLRTNPAMSVLALLGGAVVLGAALVGGNAHHWVSMVAGWALAVLGVAVMAFLQTEANVLDASMVNVIVYLVSGLLLITAGLYGRVEPDPRERTGPGVQHDPVAKV